jgi:hypothetical protein
MKASNFQAPSAWLPIAMSALALAVVAGHLLISGSAREADEGAAAHLWQLLMAGQVPIIAWFLLRRAPKEPWEAASVLAIQVGAVFVAAAPVMLLGL